jgi:hypothetical protein
VKFERQPVLEAGNNMERPEVMLPEEPKIEIVKLSNGLGYGEGSVTYAKALEYAGQDNLNKAEQALMTEQVLVPISRDSDGKLLEDDGCGDGRGVIKLFRGFKEIVKGSLHRAKVFGGGLVQGTIARIGVMGPTQENLNQEFEVTIDEFEDKGISYGGHTDDHSAGHGHSEKCGCGAIDLAPEIIDASFKYQEQITDTIMSLEVPTDGLDTVLANYDLANTKYKDQAYSGNKVMNGIKKIGQVVKQLTGPHREAFIFLNTIEGYTVDQNFIRQLTDNKVQVFAIDVWRMKDIAAKMYPDDMAKQSQAFLSELVYTLATAAVLTGGDLPVFAAKQQAA